jgi:hypothetical protein
MERELTYWGGVFGVFPKKEEAELFLAEAQKAENRAMQATINLLLQSINKKLAALSKKEP